MKLAVGLICVILCGHALAEPRTLLILHTNDIHDHVRKDYDGGGGLAYVAGYVKSVRAERGDVLLFDAGDVMEKGDLVAFETRSTVVYDAMARMGYDAIAPGNHDDAYGDEHLEACAELVPHTAFLAINLLREDQSLRFPSSAVIERNGLRVGVIGVFKPRDELSLDLDATAEAVAIEADRLEPMVHLVVVVVHLGPGDCETIARVAPNVDVFISGHTHQALQRPLLTRASQAIVVQAGSYAEYVGRLELVVDDQTEEIVSYAGELIEMKHDTIAPDSELQAWFDEKEREISPHAAERITKTESPVGFKEMAYLGAEGIRQAAEAEIGFCHMSQIIRDVLPAGEIDANAVFRTGGQRGSVVVKTSLTGAEINAYVEGLANSGRGETHWSGFRGEYEKVDGRTRFTSELVPARSYTIAMPMLEWETRYLRELEDRGGALPEALERTAVSFTDGVVALIRGAGGEGPQRIAESIEARSVGE